MRPLLLAFCLLPVLLFAQRDEYMLALEKNIPPGLGDPIRLPSAPEHLTAITNNNVVMGIHIIGTLQAYKKAFPRYIYTRDSLEKYRNKVDDWYYKLLLKYLVDSLPVIDFEKKELVIISGCGQCLAYCKTENGYHPCHRNGCMSHYRSFLRDKKYDLRSADGEKRNFLQALYALPPGGMTERTDMQGDPAWGILKFLDTAKRSSYLIQVDDSLFRKIHSWDLQHYPSNVPTVDFTKQELWVRMICHQCLMYCDANDPDWNNKSCHQGDCIYDQKWFVKELSASGN
jgi:hypothetical protein